jgi:(p)ppGpp synthase/HD superfamily hydrolase
MEITYGTKNDAISLAHKVHQNQSYGEFDYTKHLRDVSLQLGANGFSEDYWDIAAWLHDTVEDTDLTIEEVEKQFGSKVAMLVEAVTTPSSIGNRRARLRRLIELLTACPGAMPLKLADRIANVQFCWFRQNNKLFMYYREYKTFRGSLRPLNDDPRVMKMWDKLDEMLGWWEPPAKGKK